jgi:hypothetical protein
MRSLFLSAALLLAIALSSQAQDVVKVSGCIGEATISGSVSEVEARSMALQEAKLSALRKAGVSENISSYATMFKGESGKELSEFFSSEFQSEIRGAVSKYEAREEKFIDPVSKLFTLRITIDAEVVKYKSVTDPEFQVAVDGVKGVYTSGELLTFNVKVTRDCYLNIFSVTDADASLFMPNAYEKLPKLTEGISYTFPKSVEYYMDRTTKGDKPETTRLIFVFTKKQMEFIDLQGEEQITSVEKILSWIYSISPDQRKVMYVTTMIR